MNKKNLIMMILCGADAILGIVCIIDALINGVTKTKIAEALILGGLVSLIYIVFKIVRAILGPGIGGIILSLIVTFIGWWIIFMALKQNLVAGIVLYGLNLGIGVYSFLHLKEN